MGEDQNASLGEEKFSDDEHENLRIENEILRIKVKAELGGVYEGSENLSPELENEFLKNVLAFEHQFANTKKIKLHTLIGAPVFKAAAELGDTDFEKEWQRLQGLLEDRGIVVEFIAPRDDRFKYHFITGELFELETDDMEMPGMTKHFTYEEFYPDHKREIEERTAELLEGWFERSIDASSWCLGDLFIEPGGAERTKDELLSKLNSVFTAYTAFESCKYHLDEVKFELKENTNLLEGLGYAEGTVKYDAILENGERKKTEGPFKIYLSRESGWWSIYFFYLAGFNI